MCRFMSERKKFRELAKDGLIASGTQLVGIQFEFSGKLQVLTLKQRRILHKS